MNWRVADEDLRAHGARIKASSAGAATDFVVAFGELTVNAKAANIVQLLKTLRDDPELRFEQLIDICGADYPQRAKRFDVV
ncbi:MAG TPA: NADH-quinone oxidoreductase subunit C, partial [Caulobacteraceae bacterium]